MADLLNLGGSYLFDETQEIATQFGAQRTPEVFLFDAEKQLIYHGAIDDNYENASQVQQHYLRSALDDTLNNEPIRQPETTAIGCSIKWK